MDIILYIFALQYRKFLYGKKLNNNNKQNKIYEYNISEEETVSSSCIIMNKINTRVSIYGLHVRCVCIMYIYVYNIVNDLLRQQRRTHIKIEIYYYYF